MELIIGLVLFLLICLCIAFTDRPKVTQVIPDDDIFSIELDEVDRLILEDANKAISLYGKYINGENNETKKTKKKLHKAKKRNKNNRRNTRRD